MDRATCLGWISKIGGSGVELGSVVLAPAAVGMLVEGNEVGSLVTVRLLVSVIGWLVVVGMLAVLLVGKAVTGGEVGSSVTAAVPAAGVSAGVCSPAHPAWAASLIKIIALNSVKLARMIAALCLMLSPSGKYSITKPRNGPSLPGRIWLSFSRQILAHPHPKACLGRVWAVYPVQVKGSMHPGGMV
jgi:hypothetical protein